MNVVFIKIFSRVAMNRGDLKQSNTIPGIIDIQIRIRVPSRLQKSTKKWALKRYLMNWSSPVLAFSLMRCHF